MKKSKAFFNRIKYTLTSSLFKGERWKVIKENLDMPYETETLSELQKVRKKDME